MATGLLVLDYYGLMSRPNRLIPLTLAAACICGAAFGAPPPAAEGPNNSSLDGELFYQLLVSEMSVRSGEPGAAYALMLNAARKANSPLLYERAVEIALRARSGEAALDAARAWAQAFPSSMQANRFQLQILLGMNKIAETQEPVKRELARLAPAERAAAMGLLPRYFSRAADKKLAASVIEKALASELANRATGPSAWAAIGALRLQADDAPGALDAAQRGAALDAGAEEPLLLASALIGPKAPAAEAMVRTYLARKPTADVRMAYARSLVNLQRFAEAYAQAQALTKEKPDFADAWLMRGSLELQDVNLTTAESSLKTYVALNLPSEENAHGSSMGRGLVQAYLLLAQVAEQGNKLDEAKGYLEKIDSPTDALRVQRRYAGILARQGKIDEARLVIRAVPELQASDAMDKIHAEVQLLRDNRQYAAAYQVLGDAVAKYPEETELVYDLAMVAEKVGKPDEMESLLRKVIQAKPEYHHAYNALGYLLADRNIRLAEARQLIDKALTFAPNDPFIIDSLAWVEFRSGNSAEALRLLTGAFKTRPDAEIAAHLGEVLWASGQREQAAAIWKEGIALNPNNETLLETIRRLRGNP
jgi:tetratricopeptide (TPR) repeat protein